MSNLSILEAQARQFRRVSFRRIPDERVYVSILVSVPLVGDDFRCGSKTVGAMLEDGDSFLGIPFSVYEDANFGGIEFNENGAARVIPIPMGSGSRK